MSRIKDFYLKKLIDYEEQIHHPNSNVHFMTSYSFVGLFTTKLHYRVDPFFVFN